MGESRNGRIFRMMLEAATSQFNGLGGFFVVHHEGLKSFTAEDAEVRRGGINEVAGQNIDAAMKVHSFLGLDYHL